GRPVDGVQVPGPVREVHVRAVDSRRRGDVPAGRERPLHLQVRDGVDTDLPLAVVAPRVLRVLSRRRPLVPARIRGRSTNAECAHRDERGEPSLQRAHLNTSLLSVRQATPKVSLSTRDYAGLAVDATGTTTC